MPNHTIKDPSLIYFLIATLIQFILIKYTNACDSTCVSKNGQTTSCFAEAQTCLTLTCANGEIQDWFRYNTYNKQNVTIWSLNDDVDPIEKKSYKIINNPRNLNILSVRSVDSGKNNFFARSSDPKDSCQFSVYSYGLLKK